MKKLKPTSPGTRFVIRSDFAEVTTSKPYLPLVVKNIKNSGRNNTGQITVRHQGGGHKRRYRLIDFKRTKDNIIGTVETIEYDPYRSAYIALVLYQDGERRYIIAPEGIQVGAHILSGEQVPIKIGNAMPIGNIAPGATVHNVELKPGKGGQFARSAGTSVQIVNRDNNYVVIRMSSGETRKVLASCRATIGKVSNASHNLISLGKAGASRWLGIRPTVRGSAMNPVDHPLGGGEGKTRGKQPVTPWGKPTKGKKTRSNKRTDKFIVKRIN